MFPHCSARARPRVAPRATPIRRSSVKDHSYTERLVYSSRAVSPGIPSSKQLPSGYENASVLLLSPCTDENGSDPVAQVGRALQAGFGGTFKCASSASAMEAYHQANYATVYGGITFNDTATLLTPGAHHLACVSSPPSPLL